MVLLFPGHGEEQQGKIEHKADQRGGLQRGHGDTSRQMEGQHDTAADKPLSSAAAKTGLLRHIPPGIELVQIGAGPAGHLGQGVEYVVIGHSERREMFGETDAYVNKRAKAALAAGIVPIICCGETLETREAGTTNDFVSGQIKAALEGLTAAQVAGLVIAYEPIWAIGTGKTATFEQAEEVCACIRETVKAMFDEATADAVRIQYGGSVKPATIDGLMQKPNVDGALVGGASLKAADFSAIVNFK